MDHIIVRCLVLVLMFATFIAPASAMERHVEPTEWERYGNWTFPYLTYEYLPSGEVLISTTFQGGYPLDEVAGSVEFENGSYALFQNEFKVTSEVYTLSFTPSRERNATRYDQEIELGAIHDPGAVSVEVGYFSPVVEGEHSYALTTYELNLATFDYDYQLCVQSWREIFVEFRVHSMRTVPETATLDIWDKWGRVALMNVPVTTYGHLGVIKWELSRQDLSRLIWRNGGKYDISITLDGEEVIRTLYIDWKKATSCKKG